MVVNYMKKHMDGNEEQSQGFRPLDFEPPVGWEAMRDGHRPVIPTGVIPRKTSFHRSFKGFLVIQNKLLK